MLSKIKYYIRRLKQYHYYGKAGLQTYDFHFCEYRLLAAHLRRVCDFMHSDKTYTLWTDNPNNKSMKRLREATELAERLAEDPEPISNMSKLFDKYKSDRKSILDKYDRRLNRKIIPEKLYRYYFKKAQDRDQAQGKYLEDRLRTLIDKYGRGWWD